MAIFVINSEQVTAIRLTEINGVFIKEIQHGLEPSSYAVFLRTTYIGPVEFEVTATLAEAKTRAAVILTALEI